MAIARGRTLLKDNLVIGNVLMKPCPKSVPFNHQLLQKSHLLPHEQQSGNGVRAISTFCNKSLSMYGLNYQTPHTTNLLFGEKTFMNYQPQERSLSSEPTPSVVLPEEVDFSKVIFGAPKKNQKGGMFVPINYGGQFRILRLQTPVTRIPFGVSSYENQPGYSLQVAFDDYESNPKLKSFFDFVNKFDDHILKYAIKHKKDWFPGKDLINQVIEANFKKNIRSPKDAKYSHLMKFKIPIFKENAEIEVYVDQEPATMEALTPNSMIASIIEPRSVWFVSGNFGVTWTVRQSKIVESGGGENNSKLTSYSFRDSEISYSPKKKESTSPNPPPPVDTQAEEEISEESSTSSSSESDAVEKDLEIEDIEDAPTPVPAKSSKVTSSPSKSATTVSKPTTSTISRPTSSSSSSSSTVSSAVKQPVKTTASSTVAIPSKATTVKQPVKKVEVSSSPTKPPVKTVAPTKVVKPSVSPIKSSIAPKKK